MATNRSSHYAQYVFEREGKYVLEKDYGFASYKIKDDALLIQDMYVVPESRNQKKSFELADELSEIAKNKGCKYLLAGVSPQAVGATHSMLVQIRYGFKLLGCEPNMIWFKKEI